MTCQRVIGVCCPDLVVNTARAGNSEPCTFSRTCQVASCLYFEMYSELTSMLLWTLTQPQFQFLLVIAEARNAAPSIAVDTWQSVLVSVTITHLQLQTCLSRSTGLTGRRKMSRTLCYPILTGRNSRIGNVPEMSFQNMGSIAGSKSFVFFFLAGAVRAWSSDGHQSFCLDCPFPRMRI